jgi:cytochrome bd-type quinol oxidase subunit 2
VFDSVVYWDYFQMRCFASLASALKKVLKMKTETQQIFRAFVAGTLFVPVLFGTILIGYLLKGVPLQPNPEFWTTQGISEFFVVCMGSGFLFSAIYIAIQWDKEFREQESLRMRQLEKDRTHA